MKVHPAQMISVVLIKETARNTNKQSKHVFNELKKNIEEHGLDENIIIRELEDQAGFYEVIHGNHRFRAAKQLGYEEVPCVIRNDWDIVEAEVQKVKRNYVRGTIDKITFTSEVNKLREEHQLGLDVIYEKMGFEDAEAFSEYYQVEKNRASAVVAGAVSAPQVKMLDGLGQVLSEIFEKYGDTVPHSFIIFPMGGKNHMFVRATPALKRLLEVVAERCVRDKLDINIALGGLISIGMSQTDFADEAKSKIKEIEEAGTEEGEEDIQCVKNQNL